MTQTVLTATISAGHAMSSGVDCSAYDRIVRLIMPPDWTAAPLTFCVSPDNIGAYHDLYRTPSAGDFSAFEVVVPTVTPNSAVAFPSDTGISVAWFKIRSGMHASPVIQPVDRVFQIIVEKADAASDGGAAGPAGPTGPAGVAGADGAVGPAGAVGPTGSFGPPGAMGAQGVAGPAGPAGPTGPINSKGVIDGSSAAAGDKGEYISAFSAAAVNLTTLVTSNVASIVLPPGDWDIWGGVIFQPTSTGPNSLSGAISGVSATLPTNSDVTSGFGAMTELWASSMPSGKRQVVATGQCTSNSAAPKTVYLVAQASFGGGSVACSGYISARRAR